MKKQKISATFHLTYDCNLRCSYCYTGEKTGESMTQKTIDTAIAFILNEAEKKNISNLTITFFGGEPLLEKEKIYYIADTFNRHKKRLNITFNMSTNGTLMTQTVMDELSKRRIFAALSMDGAPGTNDINRRYVTGKGSSAEVIKAAKIMLAQNPATSVTCVIAPNTADKLPESVDWLFNMGFKYIVTTLDYSGDWTIKSLKTLERAYKKLGKWYEKKMLSNERFYLSFFDERIQTRTQKPLTIHERCHLGEEQFSIAPNGELYPCVQFVKSGGNPEYLLGTIERGFDNWRVGHISHQSEKEKTACAGCALDTRCGKWCSCINYMSTGRIDVASPILCHNEKILIKIVDKTADRLWKKRNNMFIHKHYNPDYPIISHIEINL